MLVVGASLCMTMGANGAVSSVEGQICPSHPTNRPVTPITNNSPQENRLAKSLDLRWV